MSRNADSRLIMLKSESICMSIGSGVAFFVGTGTIYILLKGDRRETARSEYGRKLEDLVDSLNLAI